VRVVWEIVVTSPVFDPLFWLEGIEAKTEVEPASRPAAATDTARILRTDFLLSIIPPVLPLTTNHSRCWLDLPRNLQVLLQSSRFCSGPAKASHIHICITIFASARNENDASQTLESVTGTPREPGQGRGLPSGFHILKPRPKKNLVFRAFCPFGLFCKKTWVHRPFLTENSPLIFISAKSGWTYARQFGSRAVCVHRLRSQVFDQPPLHRVLSD